MYVKFVVIMHVSPKFIWHCVNAHVICCGVPQVHSINLCNYWLRNSTINLDYSKCESVLKYFDLKLCCAIDISFVVVKWSTHWRVFIYWSGIWKHWVLLCAVLWQFLLFGQSALHPLMPSFWLHVCEGIQQFDVEYRYLYIYKNTSCEWIWC